MLKMVKVSVFLTVISVACGFSGCCSTAKLPAGDIDIYSHYASQISTLHDKRISSNTKAKYEAALAIARGVDFSYCREVKTLDKIFGGTHDAKLGEYVNNMQLVIFYYQYKSKSVRFVFQRYKNAVINFEIKIKD